MANIFLHEVLDVWFYREVQPRLRGRTLLVRYADDAILLFEREEDARRVMAVLPKRFGRYGLTLHSDKTRLVSFKRPDRASKRRDSNDGPDGPETFDFLGFTILWGKSLAGRWVVRERTAKNRLSRALKSISEWCCRHRHTPLEEQQKALSLKLRGHYGYYGRVGNRGRLQIFLARVIFIWKQWLGQRSQGPLYWKGMYRLLQRFPLPTPVRLRAA